MEQDISPMENASYLNLCNIAAALGLSINRLMDESD
jgi:hypothetical protein